MSSIFAAISAWVIQLAENIPIFWFAVLGPFLEEALAFIPSPLIMTSVGSVAATQGYPPVVLGLLVAIGTTSKTLASVLWWYAARRFSKESVERWGKYIGIDPHEMQRFQKYLKRSAHDELVLLATRCIPLFPTGAVSIAAGVLHMRLRGFIAASWIGFFFTHSLYAAVGYTGSKQLEKILQLIERYSIWGVVLFAAFFIGVLLYLWKRFFKDRK